MVCPAENAVVVEPQELSCAFASVMARNESDASRSSCCCAVNVAVLAGADVGVMVGAVVAVGPAARAGVAVNPKRGKLRGPGACGERAEQTKRDDHRERNDPATPSPTSFCRHRRQMRQLHG